MCNRRNDFSKGNLMRVCAFIKGQDHEVHIKKDNITIELSPDEWREILDTLAGNRSILYSKDNTFVHNYPVNEKV